MRTVQTIVDSKNKEIKKLNTSLNTERQKEKELIDKKERAENEREELLKQVYG